MLNLYYTSKFNRDVKLVKKRGYDIKKLSDTIEMLRLMKPLPDRYYDHKLSGNYEGNRECHITPDWLLVYRIENETLTLILTRTGTHSDIF